MMVLVTKLVNSVNLKTCTIFAKRLILDAWLVQNVPLWIDISQFIKFKYRYVKMKGK